MDSKDKVEKLGQIIIDIYPGGVKKATFKGTVGHNDVFSSKITLQRDYMTHLNEEHLRNKHKSAEANRVAAEKEATENAKKLQVKQEAEKELQAAADKIKVAEAKVAELKTVDVSDLSKEERTIHRAKFNEAKKELSKLSK